jgi:uncharacterized protein YkwD
MIGRAMRSHVIALTLVLTSATMLLSASPTLADVRGSVNAARKAGCDGKPGVSAALRSSRTLDSVAKRLARGQKLADALKASGYRALHSTSMFMSNADDAAVARTLAQRACDELRSETIREIGVSRQGKNYWVVLAQPFDATALKDPGDVAAEVLKLANVARTSGQRCGSKAFPAVPPLALSAQLSEAAREHSRDLARNNTLSHAGSDGSSPSERVTRTGYPWRTVGENVAAGPTTPETVMEGWLASPGHCENLMSPRFTEMGLGYVVDEKSTSGVYWAQVFGARKPRQ